MCGSMADIQSPTAEIRRGKKERRRKKEDINHAQGKNIMVCPITYRATIMNFRHAVSMLVYRHAFLFTKKHCIQKISVILDRDQDRQTPDSIYCKQCERSEKETECKLCRVFLPRDDVLARYMLQYLPIRLLQVRVISKRLNSKSLTNHGTC